MNSSFCKIVTAYVYLEIESQKVDIPMYWQHINGKWIPCKKLSILDSYCNGLQFNE